MLKLAWERAVAIYGPLAKRPFLVTDKPSSFIAKRFVIFVQDPFSHVRIQVRTPPQCGLLERIHATLKTEEVYWRLYNHPKNCRSRLAEFTVRDINCRSYVALIPADGGDMLDPA